MKFETIHPSKELSKYVRHYWTLEATPTSPYVHRIIPNGLTELIFYLSPTPKTLDSNKSLSDKILINGPLSSFFDIAISKTISLFSVYFLPHGLSMFLDIPMKEVYNQSIPLRYFFKDSVSQLEDDMQTAKTIHEKAVIVEQFLINVLHSKNEYEYNRINHCFNLINHSKGIIRIEELASKAYLSRRQFERAFSNFVGMSPKQFLKIVRFQNAIQTKLQNLDASLTKISANCGYYDQSHMVEDFQKLSGLSPKKCFNERTLYSDYFQ